MKTKNYIFRALAAFAILATAAIGSAVPVIESFSVDDAEITGGSNTVRNLTIVIDDAVKGTVGLNITVGPGLVATPVKMRISARKGYATFTVSAPDLCPSDSMSQIAVQLKRGGAIYTLDMILKQMFVQSPQWGSTALVKGQSYSSHVQLNAPTAVDRTIAISSDNAGVAVPTEVTIPAGQREGTFVVSVAPNASGMVTVGANFNGWTATRTQTISALLLQNLTLSATTVSGGTNLTGTITLNTVVSSDTPITIWSTNNTVATVLGTVTVPAGSRTATFPINTLTRTNTATCRIYARSGVDRSLQLTVTPSL